MSTTPRTAWEDDDAFVTVFKQLGSQRTAAHFGKNIRRVYERRARIEAERGEAILSPILPGGSFVLRDPEQHPEWSMHRVQDGTVLVGSDSHYWPDIPPTTAHRAFVKFCHDLNPAVVIKNGDELDLPSVSKHPRIGWEKRPAVIDELHYAQARLEEIASASPGAAHIWPLGNHDARFETRLAAVAPEYASVEGVHLRDHFKAWTPCWGAWINGDVCVKHRYKGGVHAAHNNTVNAGVTMVTGHLHSLKITPFTDYRGTRWGVDTGTLADPAGPVFVDYTEAAPQNWRSGFVVLTFSNGRLLDPEMVRVWDQDHVCFRGKLIRV